MTYDEAEEIIEMRDSWDSISCSCHCGNPPCSKCVDMPNEDEIKEAIIIIDRGN